ncbi:hypothetical protein JYU02_00760 [bacterium AH-315-P15]|nr:hypothetical protein [bacterium AH-315-P15]
MEYRGTNLKEVIGRAVRGGSSSLEDRRRACVHLWNKTKDLADQSKVLEDNMNRLHQQMERMAREQRLTAIGLVADIISVISPFVGRSRKVLRIIAALRRAIQGGRMSHVIRELRDFVNILSDAEAAFDKVNSIINSNRELSFLSSKVIGVRKGLRQFRDEANRLQIEMGRTNCDALPDADEGDGEFVGVSFGKKK